MDRRHTRGAMLPRPDPWQFGERPTGSPASSQRGSAAFGPWDIDKELGLSPRREGESIAEHLERLHWEADEAARGTKEMAEARSDKKRNREDRASL